MEGLGGGIGLANPLLGLSSGDVFYLLIPLWAVNPRETQTPGDHSLKAFAPHAAMGPSG